MEDDTATLTQADNPLSRQYVRHRLSLVRLGVLLLGDQAAAEDVVQDVFAALFRREVIVSHAYLRTAVVNQCRSVIRRRVLSRRKVLPFDMTTPDASEGVELAEEHRAVLAALDTLPHRQREVLVLRYYNGLSVADTATTLGLHEGTVKSTTARALHRLRGLLEGEA